MVKINTSKEYYVRKHMYQFFKDHPNLEKKMIAKHFKFENVQKSTIYDIMHRIEKNLPPERKCILTSSRCKMGKKEVKRLKKRINHHDGISQRVLARKFNVHQSTISRTIHLKTKIRYYKKTRTPKRTPEQKMVARPKCTKLAQIFRKKQVIIDDESYVTQSNSEFLGNSGFYSSDLNTTPNDIRCKRVEKFPPKLLVWIAMSPKGISMPFIAPSGLSIKEDVYIDKCLRSRLIPFIENVHKNDKVVFWPDMASAHYSNKVQKYLKSEKIEYVPRERNIANCPELRPIEDLWSIVKLAVYANGWEAKNLSELRKRICECFRKLDPELIHRLGMASFTRVDTARRRGIKNL